MLIGMSQERLAETMGLTFQQIQHYERGSNRVSASRLFHLSRVLDVSISFFFDALPKPLASVLDNQNTTVPVESSIRAQESSGVAYPGDEVLTRRETHQLVRAYYRIGDPIVRKRLVDLLISMCPQEA